MLDTLGKFREHFEINRMKEMNLLKLSYCNTTSQTISRGLFIIYCLMLSVSFS